MKSSSIGCRPFLADELLVSMKRATDAKHAVLTLVKIKYRAPEMWLNPCLICLSRLEKTCAEMKDEHEEAHGSAGGSCENFTKSGMTLRHEMSKSDELPRWLVKNIKKNPWHVKSSKITIFLASSVVTMLTLAKRYSRQVQLHAVRAD